MQSLSCQYLLDRFLDSEGQGPFLRVRLNIHLGKIGISLRHIVFRYFQCFGSAQGAICLQWSCRLAKLPQPSWPSLSTRAVIIHLNSHFVNVQALGARWRLWTVGHGVEAGFSLKWLCDKTKLSFNMKCSETAKRREK